MVIGSHNSWSYLNVRKWWMKPFAFMAKCQRVDIVTQYKKHNVRCFDLRVKFDKYGMPKVAHGLAEYNISPEQLYEHLRILNALGDTYIRVLHEVRSKYRHTEESIKFFKLFCLYISTEYRHITFWCGRNLANWEVDYAFNIEPSCEEKYSSVCSPKLIDDWWPILYAKKYNHRNILEGTDKDILLIDYVDIK